MVLLDHDCMEDCQAASKPRANASVGERFRRALRHWWHRRTERRLVAKLSRLSPRRLRDMGYDPEDIYRAVEGTWDEVTVARFRQPDDC